MELFFVIVAILVIVGFLLFVTRDNAPKGPKIRENKNGNFETADPATKSAMARLYSKR